jgi:hypothetical protein
LESVITEVDCILNVYTHPIVEVALKINEGASGIKILKKNCNTDIDKDV